MSEWIKCSERLPNIAFNESDNPKIFYCKTAVLGFAKEHCAIVVWLCKNDENDECEEYHWEANIPGTGYIPDLDFEEITHWMPLPSPPRIYD